MCRISRDTVCRANNRMIGRKIVSDKSAISNDGSFNVSVIANGKVYSQVVTDKKMREAFGKAIELKSR